VYAGVVKPVALGVALILTLATGARSFGADPPALVVQELRSRGCKVSNKKPKNIIRGEFLNPGQFDWAALCSMKKSTSLLVFPGGSTEGIAVLETISKGFSKWSISVAGQEQLKSSEPPRGWRELPSTEIDHEGIWSFVEFGEPGACFSCYSAQSSLHYYHQDRWIIPVQLIAN
jgi:hypothetical protein